MGEDSKPLSITVGDYNRDHQLDIAVANYGTNNVCVLFGNGDGTFTNQTRYPLGYDSQPTCIIFKDLNKDGWDDIIATTSGTDNIKILLNLC
jgi:VCBS repeat protein